MANLYELHESHSLSTEMVETDVWIVGGRPNQQLHFGVKNLQIKDKLLQKFTDAISIIDIIFYHPYDHIHKLITLMNELLTALA